MTATLVPIHVYQNTRFPYVSCKSTFVHIKYIIPASPLSSFLPSSLPTSFFPSLLPSLPPSSLFLTLLPSIYSFFFLSLSFFLHFFHLPPFLPSFLPFLPLLTAFLEFIDRGMGIVSLHSFLYPGFRLRMSNFVLEGKVCIHSCVCMFVPWFPTPYVQLCAGGEGVHS